MERSRNTPRSLLAAAAIGLIAALGASACGEDEETTVTETVPAQGEATAPTQTETVETTVDDGRDDRRDDRDDRRDDRDDRRDDRDDRRDDRDDRRDDARDDRRDDGGED